MQVANCRTHLEKQLDLLTHAEPGHKTIDRLTSTYSMARNVVRPRDAQSSKCAMLVG
jgi:hypothetical protein